MRSRNWSSKPAERSDGRTTGFTDRLVLFLFAVSAQLSFRRKGLVNERYPGFPSVNQVRAAGGAGEIKLGSQSDDRQVWEVVDRLRAG